MKPILHQAIHIQLKPNYPLLGLVIVISIVSCLILAALPIMFAIKLVTILLVICTSIYFAVRDILLILPWSWQALEVGVKGNLSVQNVRGQTFSPSFADSTFISANLIILNFKADSYKLILPPVILINTENNMDNLRRLRVWLRWAKSNVIQN